MSIPPRVAQLLRLLSLGHGHKVAAAMLGISPKTTVVYIARFKNRFPMQKTRSDIPILIGLALREGIVTAEELIDNAERELGLLHRECIQQTRGVEMLPILPGAAGRKEGDHNL